MGELWMEVETLVVLMFVGANLVVLGLVLRRIAKRREQSVKYTYRKLKQKQEGE